MDDSTGKFKYSLVNWITKEYPKIAARQYESTCKARKENPFWPLPITQADIDLLKKWGEEGTRKA